MTSYGQSIRTKMSCLATVGAALALAAAACSSVDDQDRQADAAVPDVSTTAAMEEQPREDPDAEEPETTPTTEPPPATETPAPTTTTTTTTEPSDPGPQITWWSTPRLYETQLSASWQVTPADPDADPEKVNCDFDLLNASGDVIGTGTADLHETNPAGRGMKAGYDPGTAEDLGSVRVSCSLQESAVSVSEYKVHPVNYQGRHPDSVFPADDEHYFDHEEVAALFPDCRPFGRPPLGVGVPHEGAPAGVRVADHDGNGVVDLNDWLDMSLDFYEEVYANWDTAVSDIANGSAATGWWTTRQLRMLYPNSELTPQTARKDLAVDLDYLDIILNRSERYEGEFGAPDWGAWPHKWPDGSYYLKDLYLRLEDAAGFDSRTNPSTGVIGRLVRDDGLPVDGPNPQHVHPGQLLLDWTDTRYNYAPVNREPAAWAMRTLLEARNANCVARNMRAHCRSGDFHSSPHMRHPSQGGSRLGSVLWSTVCPEITP